MAKSFDTETRTIGELLGRYERRQVVLPEFQRSYSWAKDQVRTFWDDLTLFEDQEYRMAPTTASYFLGSIVLIDRDDSILLLDGQQRLATATVALAALRDVARTLAKPPDEIRGMDLARDIQRELIEKDTDSVTYALTLSELDEPYFLKAIKTNQPTFPNSRLRSHTLIKGAYDLFVSQLGELIRAKPLDEQLRIIKSLRDSLTKGMALIAIVVQNEEEAYRIFETLNDRGLRLSVPDLVLNLLMRRSTDERTRKLVRSHWNLMLQVLGKRDASRFLRHYWVSGYGDIKAVSLFAAIKRELETAKLDSVNFAQECAEECESYVALMDLNVPLPTKEGRNNLEGIVKYLRITSAPPLLLAGYRFLEEVDFEKLLKAIIATQVRYVITTNQNPLDVETAFYDAARMIRARANAGGTSNAILQEAKVRLRNLNVSDNDIRSAAKVLTLERSEAIWLMTRLASSMQAQTGELAMDKTNLEHVFPKNPTEVAWPNAAALEPYTWHIGNLTILGEKLNRQAQNKSFTDKSTQYYAKSQVKMTRNLLDNQTWDEAVIMKRAQSLVDQLIKLFPAV